MNFNPTFIHHRFGHHSSHSGYDRLMDYIPGCSIREKNLHVLNKMLPYRAVDIFLKRSGVKWYSKERFIEELILLPEMLRGGSCLFHFLYADDGFRYLPSFPRVGRKSIVCTYHLPPKQLEQFLEKRNHLRHADGIIVVCRAQLDFFSSLLPKEKICYIPHGIDIDFFRPASSINLEDPFRCLFVGKHLRDFDTLVKTIEMAGKAEKEIFFDIVSGANLHPSIKNLKNVNIHINLDEIQLLSLYQRSSVLVMPLLDSTANNSILEAMACGLPVICTDIGGVRDYVDESCAFLSRPFDAQSIFEQILQCLENREMLESKREKCRQRAMEFAWPKIARMTEGAYRRFMELSA